MNITTVYFVIGIDMILLVLFFLFMTFYVKEKVARYFEIQWKQLHGIAERSGSPLNGRSSRKSRETNVHPLGEVGTAREARRLKEKGFSKEQVASRLGISTGEVDFLMAVSEMQKAM